MVAFRVLAALNSTSIVPAAVACAASEASRGALLVGDVAEGIKASLRRLVAMGRDAAAVIVAETFFVGLFILLGMFDLDHA
ncbi:MAG TPA: hypothetical protein VGN98_09525 [Tianweitania sediminis]|jgi:uncharacterized membrane protein YadS|nr:hypothetical protein [Tianweitania sediminis]